MGGEEESNRNRTMFMIGMMLGVKYLESIFKNRDMTNHEKAQACLQYGLASLDYLNEYYKDNYDI